MKHVKWWLVSNEVTEALKKSWSTVTLKTLSHRNTSLKPFTDNFASNKHACNKSLLNRNYIELLLVLSLFLYQKKNYRRNSASLGSNIVGFDCLIICKYANMQVYKFASMLKCKFVNVRMCPCMNVLVY